MAFRPHQTSREISIQQSDRWHMARNETYVPPKGILKSIEHWELQQPPTDTVVSHKDLTRCFIEGQPAKTTVLHVQVIKAGRKVIRVLLHAHTGKVFLTAKTSKGEEIEELMIHPDAGNAPPSAKETIDFVSLYLWAARVAVQEYGVDVSYPTGETTHGYFSAGPIAVSALDINASRAIAEMRRQHAPEITDPNLVNVIGWRTAKFGSGSAELKYRTSRTHLTSGQIKCGEGSWDLQTLCEMTIPISADDGLDPLPEEGLLKEAGPLCEACVAALSREIGERVIANHGLARLRDLNHLLGREPGKKR